MSSKYLEIEQTIVKSFIDANFGFPIELSGLPTPQGFDGTGLHLLVSNVHVDSNPVTLSEVGKDEHLGFLQIKIKYPRQKGHSIPLAAADTIASAYPAGRFINGPNVVVTVKRAVLGPKLIIGGFLQYTLSIYYKSQTSRN